MLPKVKESFKFAEFRQVLNEVNDVFDEDTQRATDLIIRYELLWLFVSGVVVVCITDSGGGSEVALSLMLLLRCVWS